MGIDSGAADLPNGRLFAFCGRNELLPDWGVKARVAVRVTRGHVIRAERRLRTERDRGQEEEVKSEPLHQPSYSRCPPEPG